jgi:hypothetical protein
MKLNPYSRPLSDVKRLRKFNFSFFFPMILGGGILQRKINFHLIRCHPDTLNFFLGALNFHF